MNMFDEWSQGVWKFGKVFANYNADEMPLGEWNGFNRDLEFDIGYLRHLARQTEWGARRIAEFENTSLIKEVLGVDSFDYDPQFGQDHVARLVKRMMSPTLYDNKNKIVNEGLYRFDTDTGIWHDYTKDEIVRFIISDICPFLERQLIPSISQRAAQIKDLIEKEI